nr:MAG TPA: hypothetical protein [Bacteriophage sp.]
MPYFARKMTSLSPCYITPWTTSIRPILKPIMP